MRTYKVGETTFTINKVPPKALKDLLLRHVVPLLGSANNIPFQEGDRDWQTALRAVLGTLQGFDADNYNQLMQGLYASVRYTNEQVSQPYPLADDQDNAFDGLDVVHLFELDYHVFTENFLPSWGVLLSRHPSLKAMGAYFHSLTSIPSSDTPSSNSSPNTST